jgi:hypothetical protein
VPLELRLPFEFVEASGAGILQLLVGDVAPECGLHALIGCSPEGKVDVECGGELCAWIWARSYNMQVAKPLHKHLYPESWAP